MEDKKGVLYRKKSKKEAKKLYTKLVKKADGKNKYKLGEERSYINQQHTAEIVSKNLQFDKWLRKVYDLNLQEQDDNKHLADLGHGYRQAKVLGKEGDMDYVMTLLSPDMYTALANLIELTDSEVISVFASSEKPVGFEGDDWYLLMAPRLESNKSKWIERKDHLRQALEYGYEERRAVDDFDEQGNVKLSIKLPFGKWLNIMSDLGENENEEILADCIKGELTRKVGNFIERNAASDENDKN